MHQTLLQQPVGERFGLLPEAAQKGRRRHLQQATGLRPIRKFFQPLVQKHVPLRMRNDRRHARRLHLVKHIVCSLGNEQIGKLHQDVALVVDRVLGGMLERVLNVVVGKVEIAPCMDADRAIDGPAHLLQFGGDDVGLEFEFVIGVRAGYDVGSAAFHRQPQHGDRFFERLRAIIHTGKDVAVDIDQIQINISSS